MENATKALLIAAAVLIAIVLIALGVTLLNSAGNAGQDAQNTADAINQATGQASKNIVDLLTKPSASDPQ